MAAQTHLKSASEVAGAPSPPGQTVADLLFGQPARFSFFAAARLLRLLHLATGGTRGDSDAPFRVSASISPAHPTTEVVSIDTAEPDGVPRVEVTWPSLLGTMGKLPPMYNRLVRDTTRQQDSRLQDFLDVFQNALARLYLAAREETDPRQDRELLDAARHRGEAARRHDRFTQKILNLLGLSDPDVGSGLSPDVFVRHAGLFLAREPTSEGLELILADYFGEHVRVGVAPRRKRARSRWLWPGRDVGGPGPTLPFGTDRRTAFRVSVGPLSWARFREFLPPDGPALQALIWLTRLHVGLGYRFDVRLILRAGEVPDWARASADGERLRLNWSCWLTGPDAPAVDLEAVVSLHDCQSIKADARRTSCPISEVNKS
jgi:predicted component of type VI protein secretion system